MRSDLAASTLTSALLWSMLLLSLFAAPVLMAARSADDGVDRHTAELIRQHQEATSPFSSAPEPGEGEQIQSRACGPVPGDPAMNDPAMNEEGETFVRDAAPDDDPMIRPVGTRAKRIRV